MDVQTVVDFLRKHGLSDAEMALKEDIRESRRAASCDFERFLFPMNPPLPPLRVQANTNRRFRKDASGKALVAGAGSGPDCSDDEFVSLASSTSGLCNSDFTNPYGRYSTTQVESDASSDRMSQFGTAREYHEFEMQTDLWYDEKNEGYYLSPHVGGLDPFSGPTEDKFVMTTETKKRSVEHFGLNLMSQEYQPDESDDMEERIILRRGNAADSTFDLVKDCYQLDKRIQSDDATKLKKAVVNELNLLEKCNARDLLGDGKTPLYSSAAGLNGSEIVYETSKESLLKQSDSDYVRGHDNKMLKAPQELSTAEDEQEATTPEELPFLETKEDEYEVFNLRIIHRKNRTGFEESKDLPIVLNTLIAGRYCVTEYLGSAAFSKVVQAHDIQTGVDVCLKIIKNDKDFFDQSLDEIKLLKYVNKHDPADQRHILRLYDYFYHQEHLFIVCELLRANLYEFQKYNLESGGEPYFTVQRLQIITRQCLEALDFLHSLGIIHCDLKPENVLIKSYSRCEIKVIDLGSSCFLTDNLSLYVQSRSYRAPEVILGLPYNAKIDIWSLGCILAELCSGEVLFPNDAVVILLARVIGLLGPIDLEMLLRGQETNKYFTKEFDLYYVDEETEQVEYIVPEKTSLEQQLPESDALFIDFVKNVLQINPKRRPTAREALQHPWLLHQY